jgi:hypothetical protein
MGSSAFTRSDSSVAKALGLTLPETLLATADEDLLWILEQAGDAMRQLNSKGQIAWKATPRMLTRLADAEQEARDDAVHDLL